MQQRLFGSLEGDPGTDLAATLSSTPSLLTSEAAIDLYANSHGEEQEESDTSNEAKSLTETPESVVDFYAPPREELEIEEAEPANRDASGRREMTLGRRNNEESNAETGQSHAKDAHSSQRPLEEIAEQDVAEWMNHKNPPDRNFGEGPSGGGGQIEDERPPVYDAFHEGLTRLNAIAEQVDRLREGLDQGAQQLEQRITGNMRAELQTQMRDAADQFNRLFEEFIQIDTKLVESIIRNVRNDIQFDMRNTVNQLQNNLDRRNGQIARQIINGVRNEFQAEMTVAVNQYHTDMQALRSRLRNTTRDFDVTLRRLEQRLADIEANQAGRENLGREDLVELRTDIDRRFGTMAGEIVEQVRVLLEADRLIRPAFAPQEDNASQYRKKFVQGMLAGGAGGALAGSAIVIGLLAGHVIDNQPGGNNHT